MFEMNYNRSLTENLQKLIQSRKNLLHTQTSENHVKESYGNDGNSDAFDETDKKNGNNSRNSTQSLKMSNESISNKSIENQQPLIENFVANEQQTSHQLKDIQVRGIN